MRSVKGTRASWTLASTTEGRFEMNLGRAGRILKMRRNIEDHDILTPARSGKMGSKSFTSKGGFPEGGALRCSPAVATERKCVEGTHH